MRQVNQGITTKTKPKSVKSHFRVTSKGRVKSDLTKISHPILFNL